MRIVMKEVEMIAYFQKEQYPIPLRFRIRADEGKGKKAPFPLLEEDVVVPIDKILYQTKEKHCGNVMILYACESLIQNQQRRYELKYELSSCKWYIYKI